MQNDKQNFKNVSNVLHKKNFKLTWIYDLYVL